MTRRLLAVMLALPVCVSAREMTLDMSPRAREYQTTYAIPATEAQFHQMQQHYRPQDFDIWAKRLRQLRSGMTENQVFQILRPKELGIQLGHSGSFSDIIVLNDAYFAQVFFEYGSKRMISTTTPLAMSYDVKSDHHKPKI